MDSLSFGYLVACAAGAGFSLLSWALGAAAGHGSGAHHGAVAGHGNGVHHGAAAGKGSAGHAVHGHLGEHSGGRGGSGRSAVLSSLAAPFVNLSAISVMATVGGGIGYVMRQLGAAASASLALAVPSALAGGYLISGLMTWLAANSHYLEPTHWVGSIGTVLAPIGGQTTGEALFTNDGVHTALPARSKQGRDIARGERVVIADLQNGVAIVEREVEFLQAERG